MKFRFLPYFLAVSMLLFVACSDDDDGGGTITPSYDITISNMVPISGPIGTTIKLTGSNFGTETSELSITFGGIAVTPDSLTDTQIWITVPAALPIGATTIKVQRQTGKSVSVTFTVLDPIVGEWLSEGDDIAPLLYNNPFLIRKIVATFKADGSYIVVQTDSNNVSGTLTGTYVTAEGGVSGSDIRPITASPASPPSITAEGIYEVVVGTSDSRLTYEVVQTEPSIGVSKPTPEGGFGSTASGAFGMTNVQKYVKVK